MRFGPSDVSAGDRAEELPGLSLRQVTKQFVSGDSVVTALNNVNLDLRKGECAALLGPSGAGKSTLLMIAGCLMAPTAGSVVINGNVLYDSAAGELGLQDDRAFRRKHIGFVFQKAHLIPFLTAVENVQIAMEINDVRPSEARERAQVLLDDLGVGNRAGNLPRQLSGGQQQRVAVARALANEPSLILADEPTAALDAQRARQVMELFQHIAHARGASVIVVTHDHRSLEHFDRILMQQDGRLTERYAEAAVG